MDDGKHSRYWLALSIALAAVVLQGLSLWVQILHEQAHDKADYAPLIGSALLTILAWVVTIIAAVKNWKDSNRAEALRAQIVTVKEECETQLRSRDRQIDDLRLEHIRHIADVKAAERDEYYKCLEREEANWRLAAAIDHGKLQEAYAVEIDDLKRRLSQTVLSREQLDKVMIAGVLLQLAKSADSLNSFLEEIWQLWDNAGHKLKTPLAGNSLPDKIEEHRDFELLKFRTLYRQHIKSVKETVADFHTNLIDDGFPCNDDYLSVRRKIEAHAAYLRDRADREARPFLD